MSEGRLRVEQRLALNSYVVDKEPHIRVKYDVCRSCIDKPCTYVCPARLYTIDEDGNLHFNHVGCLECGACRLACPHGAIEWSYPRGGRGVHYQFG